MSTHAKFLPRSSVASRSARMVEQISGCKWSLTVYQLLAAGINRPGAMVRSVEGLSTKVLNDCLRKNQRFGIIERIAYPEVPPRVEYVLTPFGTKFVRIVDELDLEVRIGTQEAIAFREHGPNLEASGSKLNAGWLYAWLRDPKAYWHETKMPNLCAG